MEFTGYDHLWRCTPRPASPNPSHPSPALLSRCALSKPLIQNRPFPRPQVKFSAGAALQHRHCLSKTRHPLIVNLYPTLHHNKLDSILLLNPKQSDNDGTTTHLTLSSSITCFYCETPTDRLPILQMVIYKDTCLVSGRSKIAILLWTLVNYCLVLPDLGSKISWAFLNKYSLHDNLASR